VKVPWVILTLKWEEVPPSKPTTIQIGNFDKDEFQKKKTKKQLLEDGVNYEKINPYASIPFPQILRKQRDDKQF
jgi:hypothetical protein